MVEQEAVEGQEVASPRHHDGHHGGNDEPPTLRPFDDKAAQQEQEHHDGTEIDGARCERLVAPIEWSLFLSCAACPLAVFGHTLARAAARSAGNKQRIGLADAIAPAEGIVDVEAAFLVVLALACAFKSQVVGRDANLAATTHCRLGIFFIHCQMAIVAACGKEASHKQYADNGKELRKPFVFNGVNHIGQTHNDAADDGVERDLKVVESYLQAGSKGEQNCAPHQLPPVDGCLTLSAFRFPLSASST